MLFRKHQFLIPIILGALVIAGLVIFWPAPHASAQCGSQASSCKNCHEVQGQDPVNNDGTGWHQSHAFGDFCYICHAGNNQSMDKDTAHTGMVPPLSDVKAACQSCHPNDLQERAQVYATALGVEIGTGGGASSGGSTTGGGGDPGSGSSPTSGSDTTSASASSAPAASGMVIDTSSVIDYNQQYSETVLGQRNINWGNITLGVLIVLVAGSGGVYVFWNERKLRGLPIGKKGKAGATTATTVTLPKVEGYSDEVVALLPKIAQLNPLGQHALKRLLENPEEASELLHSLSRLDPELVRQVRSLDRDSRALLLALAGD
jgi:hypothetical protein